MKKKLLKTIQQEALLNKTSEGKTYTGSEPVIVDNTANKISLDTAFVNKVNSALQIEDLSNYTTKQELTDATHTLTIEDNKLQGDIDLNTTQINSMKEMIKVLQDNQANDVSFVGEISTTKTYNLGDYGYVGDNWFICIKDNSNGDTSNTANWKATSVKVVVDLSDYYTKSETLNLLSPLRDTITKIEAKDKAQDLNISKNASEIDTINSKLPTLATNESVNVVKETANANSEWISEAGGQIAKLNADMQKTTSTANANEVSLMLLLGTANDMTIEDWPFDQTITEKAQEWDKLINTQYQFNQEYPAYRLPDGKQVFKMLKQYKWAVDAGFKKLTDIPLNFNMISCEGSWEYLTTSGAKVIRPLGYSKPILNKDGTIKKIEYYILSRYSDGYYIDNTWYSDVNATITFWLYYTKD